MEAMRRTIPRVAVRTQRNLPWMSREIRQKIKKRNRLYKEARTSGNQGMLMKYKSLRNELVSLLRQSKIDYVRRVSKDRNKKRYWKAIKFLKKSNCCHKEPR